VGCKGFPLICLDHAKDGASALNQAVPFREVLLLGFSGSIGSGRSGREFRINAHLLSEMRIVIHLQCIYTGLH